MTVHTPSALTRTPAGSRPHGSKRPPVMIGLVLTLVLLAAVVVAGRVAATRTSSAPTTTPAVTTTHQLNEKALADQYTAGMRPSSRDDIGAMPHRRASGAPAGVQSGYGDAAAVQRHVATTTHELNEKALADRYVLTCSTTHELNEKALADRYVLTSSTAHRPGVHLRRQPLWIPPQPTVP